jgi:multiple sugar transport system substrate-binding protein/putative aldouronate transport system substrate-binding protein
VAITWYPLRNVMGPSDEMEHTYTELLKLLNGKSQASDYNDPSSVYKLLYTDAQKVKSVVNPPFDNINVSNFNQKTDFGEFQRVFSTFVGDKPFATIPIDKKVFSITYSQTATMDTKWANLWKIEQQTTLQIIVGKAPISSFDQFVSDWKSQGGDDILKEVQQLDKK